MSDSPSLLDITPTLCLRGREGSLQQLVQVKASNPGLACQAALIVGAEAPQPLLLPPGESAHDIYVPEPRQTADVSFALQLDGALADERTIALGPPPHLQVHVVQHSHHDVGYTNLPSAVLREHLDFLSSALDMADATRDFPDEARFRLVIEQAWSLQEFLRRASPGRVERMGELLRSGDFELTALFGNMVTELCGPEELVRALYPSRRIARRFGFAIATAEHNDVPGMSWGLAQVLTEAGIRLFCPQLPRYWDWCDPPLQTFWDESVLFPQGQPGCFWWEAPSGKRVLLWDAYGSGGDVRPDLPGLEERLRQMVERGYPYRAVYWPVRGGARDNSPYIIGFAETVRDWNARWTYPRLISSTNAGFRADLEREIPADLPVFRGELPGQDYPVGSLSTSAATATNRGAHVQLLVAERLATLASATTDYEYPAEALDQAYEDALWHDEHTWGHHFPAGPAAAASEAEKQVHAYRAAALAHDATSRALARIADHVKLPGEGLYLLVFNPLPYPRTAPIAASLRELENCGSHMVMVSDGPSQAGYLRGVPLTDRWHLHPPEQLVRGEFDLVDADTDEVVPFQITPVEADSPVPYAPQRFGLAHGGRRYGFFEVPGGLGWDLRFVSKDLPACGYRTYRLRPRAEALARSSLGPRPDLVIENEFYRLQADPDSGRVVSLIDIEADRELLDPEAPHALGQLIVRTPERELEPPAAVECRHGADGPVFSSLDLTAGAPGHPRIRQVFSLHRGVKRLDLAVRLLKDPTPLLDMHLAFPFLIPEPQFHYEGVLSVQTPLADYLPGAYWDEVTVQNWIRISGGGLSLLWSSLDSPMVSLGRLTEGYTSPAHSCIVPDRAKHPPAGADQLAHGWLYSLLCANNFGTNFAVSQSGSLLFRYSLTTRPGELTDEESARLGWEVAMPCETVYIEPRRAGHLPLSGSLLHIEGEALVLLACKRAEVGEGFILRFWNPASETAEATVHIPSIPFAGVQPLSLTEDSVVAGGAELLIRDDKSFCLRVAPGELATVRLTPLANPWK